MKNMVKKNQIMITALAIMIAVAGYLNFAGETITEEEIMTAGSDSTVLGMDDDMLQEDTEVAALFEISDEDLENAQEYDIESLDSEVIAEEENYLEETMEDILLQNEENAEEDSENLAEDTMASEPEGSDIPGEAVYTMATDVDTLSGAKLLKEQTRAKNKETLLEIINNANIADDQKQEAIDNMIAITDVAEKETAAEILLEAKGFEDVVVSIDADTVDVVVSTQELSQAQRAQIEDIVVRKTGVLPENIVISTITEQ